MSDSLTGSDLLALWRWDSEGGATPYGPQQSWRPGPDFEAIEESALIPCGPRVTKWGPPVASRTKHAAGSRDSVSRRDEAE